MNNVKRIKLYKNVVWQIVDICWIFDVLGIM